MTKKRLEQFINKQLDANNDAYLANYLHSNFEVYYLSPSWTYTKNRSAAVYDVHGSCTNSFLKCDDGFVPDPF